MYDKLSYSAEHYSISLTVLALYLKGTENFEYFLQIFTQRRWYQALHNFVLVFTLIDNITSCFGVTNLDILTRLDDLHRFLERVAICGALGMMSSD